jgi:predicted Zn-dependent peptidase
MVLVCQKLEGYKSVTIGVWVKTGSSYEAKHENGMSHFIEHMVFKGTESRSAKDIAMEIDGIGGEINAYTAKECTCYYTKTMGADLEVGLDILSDITIHPSFLSDNIETEKTVILDEISMYEDSAEELVDDIINEITFKNHPLSLPILGTKETIMSFTREKVIEFYEKHYRPDNMIISVAGDFDFEALESLANKYFGVYKRAAQSEPEMTLKPEFNWGCNSKKKDFEQIQVAIEFPGIPFDHELSYDMTLLSNLFGGTNSSRLFQSIREDRGLAYSIYSEPSFYDEIGTLSVSFGVAKENLKETIKILSREINRLITEGFSEKEIDHAKSHLRGSFVLGLEGSDQHMDLIGRIELFAHKEKSVADMLKKIETVSLEGVQTLIRHCFTSGDFSLAIVGDIANEEVEKLYGVMKNSINQQGVKQ